MFSIYIIYSGYRVYSICSYSMYMMVDRAIYNWVDIVWGWVGFVKWDGGWGVGALEGGCVL